MGPVRDARTVHVLLPNDIDDPAAPSGGNAYDRRVCDGLAALGWAVREHPARGGWPAPARGARDALGALLAGLPERAIVLADGLVASGAPEVVAAHAGRLRLAVLVHMPVGGTAERAMLAGAAAVITTSEWTRGRLALPDARVAAPGVDSAPAATGSPAGTALLCVAAVLPHKGHDVLAAALEIAGLGCTCVGSVTRDPHFVAGLRGSGRLRFAGVRTGPELDAAYAAADLLVLPSRAETYGMVLTEALARGIPVLASAVGGVPEALGTTPDGPPGMLVPPGDVAALAAALRAWRDGAALRDRLRAAALARRGTLRGWADTASRISEVLGGLR